MDFKALALDLDGTTLVGEELPEANRLALQRAVAAGYEIIVATARWLPMAQRIARQIGPHSVSIACSGAQVHDSRQGRDIFDVRLPADFTADLFALCNAHRCIATVTVSERVLLKLDGAPDPDLLEPIMQWVPQLVVNYDDLPRIAAVQGSQACELIKQRLQPKYAGQVNIFDSIGPTGKLVLTITGKAASKGAALAAACGHLHIDPQQVIAFGDAENDLAMFALAGASVAMGQAQAEVRQAADYVSAANYDNGVAQAVDLILARGRLP